MPILNRLLLLAVALMLPGALHAQQAAPPNVVLVIADQMRGDAVGALGHPDVRTPHLDALASEGVAFTHFYTNGPVCVPSRMSFFSGLYPHRHGSVSNAESTRLATADGTLLGYFRDRGYRLGWFGKDNHTYRRAVLDQTLDANTSRRREAFRAYSPAVPPHWHGHAPWPKDTLFAVRTTDDAIRFIRETPEGTPFFAVLSLFDPHPPYFAPAEIVRHYARRDLTVPDEVDPAALSPRLAAQKRALLLDRLDPAELEATMAVYYAAIEWGVDAQIGRLLQALDEAELTDDTIVVVTSEHGDFMGDFGMVRKGMFLYDALLHVPFVWRAPGRIAEGVQTDVVAQGVDLFPTLVALTGGTVPEGLPGRSLLPFLRGASETDPGHAAIAVAGYSDLPEDYFENPEPSYIDPPPGVERAFHSRIYDRVTPPRHRTASARTRNWRLILSETHPPELYHVGQAGTERENLAGDPRHRAVLDTLREAIEQAGAW